MCYTVLEVVRKNMSILRPRPTGSVELGPCIQDALREVKLSIEVTLDLNVEVCIPCTLCSYIQWFHIFTGGSCSCGANCSCNNCGCSDCPAKTKACGCKCAGMYALLYMYSYSHTKL